MQFNKKGEVGETMTWIVATLIILVLVFLFLFAINVVAKSKGVWLMGDSSMGGNSNIENQQMLFAILKENNGNINNLIKASDSNGLQVIMEDKLNKFAEMGLLCDFYVSGGMINIAKGGKGEYVKMDIEGKEVGLRC